MKTSIQSLHARRVWDSRGKPTIEAEITLENGARGRAISPSGASTGSGEAVERRDGGAAHGGADVTSAIAGIANTIAPGLVTLDAADQSAVDHRLIELDGTENRSRLGGNALIAVSMAVAHAAAAGQGVPLWTYLAGDKAPGFLPLPEIQIFGGGAHAGRRIDIQDLMVIAVGAEDFGTALDWTAEVYRAAGELMAESGRIAGVADEGGFWPLFATNEEALSTLVKAIERAGFRPGEDVAISLDIASSEFGKNGRYRFDQEDRDFDSDDQTGLAAFPRAADKRLQVVGDDYLVTSARRVEEAATLGACNAVLIKPNQAGTLTEAKAALDAANSAGYSSIVSARSGETEDTTIVHLAVGWGIRQLKVGSFARSERMAKWNEGLRLAEVLPTGGLLPPRNTMPWGAGS